MSSVRTKRTWEASQDADFRIKTAAGDPIPCRSVLVRTFSACADQLPAGAEEWDVSGFLIEGEPFSRETVKCWLSCGYALLYGPAQMDPQDQAQLCTANGLHHVLAFAHAVGAPEGLLQAACSQLQELVIEVQLPEQKLQLPVSAAHTWAYWINEHGELLASTVTGKTVIGKGMTSDQEKGVKQQVAAQTAVLLHVAHVLHLQPLLDAVHRFIMLITWSNMSIFTEVLDEVFSDAVLEAALGSSTVSREAYISIVLTQPCSLVDSTLSSQGLLKPIGKFKIDSDTGRVDVPAQMLRDFAGAQAGQNITLSLDLFSKDGLALGLRPEGDSSPAFRFWFAARLLLGNSIGSDGRLAV